MRLLIGSNRDGGIGWIRKNPRTGSRKSLIYKGWKRSLMNSGEFGTVHRRESPRIRVDAPARMILIYDSTDDNSLISLITIPGNGILG